MSAAQHLQRTVIHVAFEFAGLGGTTPKWGRYSLGILVAMWTHCLCVSSGVYPHKMKVVFYLKPINFHFIWCVHYLQVLMPILSHIMRQQELLLWEQKFLGKSSQCQLYPGNMWSAAVPMGCSAWFLDVCFPHGAPLRGNALLAVDSG